MELLANIRQQEGEKTRKEGKIPAILYGHKIDNLQLEINYLDFEKLYREAGENTVIDLKIGNDSRNVLIHDVQRDVLTNKPMHIDFYQVRMDEKITVSVPLVFVGESSAVKDLAGVLVCNVHEVEVEALPKDLPHEITVDISAIKNFDDHIYIKDLPVSKQVEIMDEPESIVASVVPPRSEEELASLEEKPEEKVGEIKVEAEEKKKAKEDEEGAEAEG